MQPDWAPSDWKSVIFTCVKMSPTVNMYHIYVCIMTISFMIGELCALPRETQIRFAVASSSFENMSDKEMQLDHFPQM